MSTTTKRTRTAKANKIVKDLGLKWLGDPAVLPNGSLSGAAQVTPEFALEALTNVAPNQRNVRERRVAQISRAMEAEEFDGLNGETAKIDVAGFTADGQHRLLGALDAEWTGPMLFVVGVDEDAADTMDVGAARSFPDVLKRHGEVNTHILSSATRLLWFYQFGGVLDTRGGARGQGAAPQPNIPELLSFLEKHPGIRESVKAANRTKQAQKLMTASAAISLHYLFGLVDEDDRDAFFDGVENGVGLDENDPIYRLRERLLERALSQSANRNFWTQQVITALIIKAWNLWRDGRTVQQLRVRLGGSAPESYPEISGLDRAAHGLEIT